MSDWPVLYSVLWIIAVVAAVAALIALPFVYRKGQRQIDAINWRLDTERDQQESVSNVRRLRADELHRRVMRDRGDAS